MNSAFGGSEKIWINAQIATMNPEVKTPYGLLKDHALGVKNGTITLITPMQDLAINDFQGEIIDAQQKYLTPGLVDSHTHLIYGGQRSAEFSKRLHGATYEEISRAGGGILSTVNATRALGEDELAEQARPRLEALIHEGVTTVEIKSGYGLTFEDELKILRAAKKLAADFPIRLRTTLLAAHAVPPEYINDSDRYIELVCKEMIPLVATEGLADAVDVFCEKIAFSPAQSELVFAAAQKAGLGIKVHAEQLSNSHGAELAAGYSAWSVDHLEYLDEAGIKAMKKSGTVATLLPGAFYFLGETKKPPVELLRQYQVPMALASDLNPGSSPLASLLLMLNMGCVLFGLTPEEALQGATRHGAMALGSEKQIGTLSVGRNADMVLWNIEDPAQLAYQFGTDLLVQRIFAGDISHA
ncbi:imidazolonepropionase [uncultured Desulfuromusa sp.]|uniref:imidazolonepropionase n=1 Tax=uncultured Desulfuromusa sp. TaxID=219183 RepID=UPI002AA8F377|nr:imidazolonepropionase [uncultured Desulfuromusa sp.]